MKLSSEQCDNLKQSVSLCHAALDSLDRAVDWFPVVGDAELHVMRLDLKSLANRLRKLRVNAAGILAEESK